MPLSADAALAFAIVFATLLALAVTAIPAELILLAAMVALMVFDVISVETALAGFANASVITVAVLYVVVAGLRETGAIYWVANWAFARPKSLVGAQSVLMAASGLVSTLVNNTPVVAMFIPIAKEWSLRYGFPLSKLLLPMNALTILAGTSTLIGTNTNLVVVGLLNEHIGHETLGLFDIAAVGVPLAAAGFLYVLLLGRHLLPDRQRPVEQLENAREYAFEARVLSTGGLAGKTIGEVGLRSMKNAYVLEIHRGDHLLTAVGPGEILQPEDRLVCVGVVDAVVDMRRIPGLAVAEEQTYRLNLKHSQRMLFEIVLAPSSPLAGQTVREAAFRSHYSAAVLSVSRDGQRLPGKVGDIRLRGGDTLLIEASRDFASQHRYNRDFLLVSPLRNSTPPNFRQAPLAVAVLTLMILAVMTGLATLLECAFVAAGFMIVLGCVTPTVARRSIEHGVVVAIAASFALGAALTESGAAEQIAQWIASSVGTNAMLALIVLYAASVVVTELVTNTACAVVMFPIAVSLSEQCGASIYPFAIAIMIAASAGFISPIGYQTNLMIYGPGGYRLTDFARFGAPLTLLSGAVAVAIIPIVWPF